MTGREQSPAVGATLGNPEFIARLQPLQNRQVVDAAFGALGESESGQATLHQVAVLNAHQTALLIIVRYLQPRHFLSVLPRSQPTPANHALIQMPLRKKKTTGFRQKKRMFEITGVTRRQTLPRPLPEGRGVNTIARVTTPLHTGRGKGEGL